MPVSYRLQTTYQDQPPKVDRAHGILRSITAMQANVEALGHGVQADMTTLHTLSAMGNVQADGIRSRFGHPGISENATGKKVAMARGFSVRGDRLTHDSYLLDAARKSPVFAQDPIEYILDMAEKTPRELGESVVIDAETVWPLDDGRELPVEVWGPGKYYPDSYEGVEMKDGRPVRATTPLPVLRPVNFHFVDFVGEPALVRDGLTPMSADAIEYLFAGRASEYAQELFRIVDEWRARYHMPLEAIPAKVDQIVTEYMAARRGKEVAMSLKRKQLGVVPGVIKTTLTPLNADMTLHEAEPGEELSPILSAEPEAADSPVDDDLAAAESTTETTAGEMTDSETQMSSDLAQLRRMYTAQGEQIKRLSALVRTQAEMTQVLQRNVKRLAGEPVVTERVPKAAQPAMEEFSYQHPAPRFAMETPTHVSERAGQAKSTGDAWTDGATRQMNRSRRVRGQAGGN